MTQNQQRFSGRELSQLLSQVRQELGERATIIEANRLREGGIGGFFSKERFEVVASADDDPSTVPPAPGIPHVDGLLSRAEQVSGDERRAATPAMRGDGTPVDVDGPADTDIRFHDILRGALLADAPAAVSSCPADAAAAGVPIAAPAPGGGGAPQAGTPAPEAPRVPPPAPPLPPAFTAAPVADAAPQPGPPPAAPPPRPLPGAAPAAPAVEHPAAAGPGPAHQPAAAPGGDFWQKLERFEQVVDASPLDAPLTTIVGPLEDAVGVARHVARARGVELGDLVVFTEARSVDGIPPWQVVDRRDDLADRVRYWRANNRPAVVVVDLEDGERGLERCARTVEVAAADMTRLAVRDLDDPAGLARTLRGLGPVGAIDVSRPPSPERLVEVVERGVRIGTVCGRPLTPVLLAGLAATIVRDGDVAAGGRRG